MLISPSSSTLHSLSLSLSFSQHDEVDSIADPFTQLSQPEQASAVVSPSERQTDRQKQKQKHGKLQKKKEFIISVLIAFFILSKFSAPAGAISRVTVTSRTPHLPRGRGILHVQATSFTNKQLFARNSIMPFNNRRDKLGEISYTN